MVGAAGIFTTDATTASPTASTPRCLDADQDDNAARAFHRIPYRKRRILTGYRTNVTDLSTALRIKRHGFQHHISVFALSNAVRHVIILDDGRHLCFDAELFITDKLIRDQLLDHAVIPFPRVVAGLFTRSAGTLPLSVISSLSVLRPR